MTVLNKTIKTAIVGYGQSGELSHAYGIQQNTEFEIAAICDLSPERRDYARQSLGCDAYSDHRELLQAHPDLELATVITRTDTHCDLTCDLLAAGVNVLVTKPWAIDAAEAERMMEAEKRSGKRIFP